MGTIAEKLSYLADTKDLFKDRLNSLGATITSSTTFRNYLNWLDTFYEEVSDKTDLSQNGVVGRTSQNTTILPSEYTQVDYIESSGTQYIDTGVNADYKLSVKFEFSNLSQNSYQGAMSGNNTTNRIRHHLQMTGTNNVAYWAGLHDSGCSTIIIAGTDYDSSKKYNIFADIYNQKYYLDGVEISGIFNSNDFDTGLNYYLFGRDTDNGVASMIQIKIYSFKMYYENELVRDFIPCYRNSDNEIGLYDLVNNVFYTNKGTGAFTYGSVVSIPNPDYPQPINNLSGDVPYKIIGKNLFDKDNPNIMNAYFSTAQATIISNSVNRMIYIPIKPNTTYTMQKINSAQFYLGYINELPAENIEVFGITNTTTNIDTNHKSITITTGANAKYLVSRIYQTSQDTTITLQQVLDSIQIEENPTATEYEPYIEPQTFNIPLGDIELCDIDTYEDKIYSSNGRF